MNVSIPIFYFVNYNGNIALEPFQINIMLVELALFV